MTLNWIYIEFDMLMTGSRMEGMFYQTLNCHQIPLKKMRGPHEEF